MGEWKIEGKMMMGLVWVCLWPVLHSQGSEGVCASRDGKGASTRCTLVGKTHWLGTKSWCETGCGFTGAGGADTECCEATCCAGEPLSSPRPSPLGCAAVPPNSPKFQNSKCSWPGWATRRAAAELGCETGCGVAQGRECCESSCCATSATASCSPFDLKTRHLVVVSDTPGARRRGARRQLLHDDNRSHIALEVGAEVTVGCEQGYVSPANLAYLNDRDVLKCTAEDSGPAVAVMLTCVPPALSTVSGGSQSYTGEIQGGDSLESGSSHVWGGLITLAGFCAAACATVIVKRKHVELELQFGLQVQSEESYSGPRRSLHGSWRGSWRGGMPQFAFGGAAPSEVKQEMEMGMMAGSMQGEATKSFGTAPCPIAVPGEFPLAPQVELTMGLGTGSCTSVFPGDAPKVEPVDGLGDPASHLYGDQFWVPESPSSDGATDISTDGSFAPWQIETSEFSTTAEAGPRYACAHLSFLLCTIPSLTPRST